MKKSKTKARAKTSPSTQRATSSRTPARRSRTNDEPEVDVNGIRTNGAIELEPHLLSMKTSGAIARSLKRSADRSLPRETAPFHSAMGVLNGLVSHVELLRARLEAAKKDLRELYGESGDDKPAIANEPTPPREFGKRRNGAKHPAQGPKNVTPSDNRPRSRPNKVV